jgi:AraC-like DNA-binding protein
MAWSEARVPISLADRPRIVQMGFGSHGRLREEFYQIKSWTLHIYYYGGNIRVNGADFPIRFGYMGVNPPGAETLYRFDEPDCRHIWAHFEAPGKGKALRTLPIMHDVNADFTRFNASMDEMLKCHFRDRLRAEVILWELLFRLAGSAQKALSPAAETHPAVNAAMDHVEKNLSQYLPAASVAKAAGLSHNHLNRLFKARLGRTLKEYILDRRMEKAAYFLASTRLPIKSTAVECGLPDLQHFNKTIRKRFGMPPTELRKKKRFS